MAALVAGDATDKIEREDPSNVDIGLGGFTSEDDRPCDVGCQGSAGTATNADGTRFVLWSLSAVASTMNRSRHRRPMARRAARFGLIIGRKRT